jgi:predicted RNase H-like HicB family nuclease
MTTNGSHLLHVEVHHEDGCWWATSSGLPGWSASADTRERLAELIAEGVDLLRPDAPYVTTGPVVWA